MGTYLDLLPKNSRVYCYQYLTERQLLDYSQKWASIIALSKDFWIEKLDDDFVIDFKNYEFDGISAHDLYHVYTIINEMTPEYYLDIDILGFIDKIFDSNSVYHSNLELLLIFYKNPQHMISIMQQITQDEKILGEFYQYLLQNTDKETGEKFLYKVMVFGDEQVI